MLTRYHVTMPKTWRGPSKVILRLTVGDSHAPVPFKKTQTDKSASDYPSKTLWLEEQTVVQLKKAGFSLRKAKVPVVDKKQNKPKKGDN